MGSWWRIANRSRQEGQLDHAKAFLPRTGELSACSVSPPMDMDKKAAIDMAGALCSGRARSLEIWWDGPKHTLQIVLVAEAQDMGRFQAGVAGMYPGAAFSDMGRTTPEWYDPAASAYRIFDVGLRHGHYAAAYDTERVHQLMTQVAGSVQSYEYAWVQVVFARCDLTGPLDRHAQRLDARYKEIRRGNYLSFWEQVLHSNAKPHDHPDLGRDFMNNYPRLRRDALLKRQGGHILLSMRGMAQADSDVTLPLDGIGAPPAGGSGTAYEHLTTYPYKYDRFYSDKKKSRIRLRGQKDASQRIAIFESRLLPAPARLLEEACSVYFDKGWSGGYRQRPPLPFVILAPSELLLFAHLPDPSTPNMGITRGAPPPPRPSGKAGAGLGFFEPDGAYLPPGGP